MAREIKFRAWDAIENKMVQLVTVGCTRNDLWRPLYERDDRMIEGFNHDNFEVMQYTGLRDKNGVEIYEGDILTDGFILPVHATVVWNRQSGQYVMEVGGEFWGLLAPVKDYYVVGNIYENPELLGTALDIQAIRERKNDGWPFGGAEEDAEAMLAEIERLRGALERVKKLTDCKIAYAIADVALAGDNT